ncbi:MAG TPA: hypothetical protein VFM39_00910, partial [bacterium]|nr:hypothetical protein [bacterium]
MKASPADVGEVILEAAPQQGRPRHRGLDSGLVLRGNVITGIDDRHWSDGGVAIGADGRVHAAGLWEEVLAAARPSAQVADHRPHWIVPGMVDLH